MVAEIRSQDELIQKVGQRTVMVEMNVALSTLTSDFHFSGITAKAAL
jgi:hypothetical protein